MLLRYLERGVAAGAIAGLGYGAFVAAVVNPFVEHAESLVHYGHGHDHAHSVAVAETTTAAVGVGGGILWGILLGGMFGLAYYVLEPSLPGTGTMKAYVLAGAGFLTVSVVPWLVLPPPAPGTEHALGTDARLLIYVALMALGALVGAASILGYRRAAPRGRAFAVAVAAVPVAVVVVALPLAAPAGANGGAVPGELVAAFRGVVVSSQAALWAVIAASYGWLHRRASGSTGASAVDRSSLADP
ncbi:CbtA family protein [Halegenticoccus soli]|uniref:CbtA family protein n=1 Tax=Halegenticoccus soli TaxID=1985678 RepID=UPI000C6D7D29|nr:CbtA family protein [Halegenticoccus soli]